MICETCGGELRIGDFPFCHGDPQQHAPQATSVVGDEIPGGQIIENLGHEPMRFDSKRAILAEADRRGLQPMVRYVPGDQHLTNWAAGIDPQTLANAAELVMRRARRSVETTEVGVPCETAVITVEAR